MDGEVEDDALPQGGAVPNLDVDRYFLEQALPVMGMQHCVYNLLQEVHTALPFWRELWDDLKNLEGLLNWNFRRRRYIATCLRGTQFEGLADRFESFNQSLYEPRWREVSKFLVSIEPLLPVLRSTWDAQRFQNVDAVAAGAAGGDHGGARAPGNAASFNPDRLTQCLRCPRFAARVGSREAFRLGRRLPLPLMRVQKHDPVHSQQAHQGAFLGSARLPNGRKTSSRTGSWMHSRGV